MRQIKFRGKRKYGSEWIVGDLNYISGEVFIFDRTDSAPTNSPDWFEVNPNTVGQFTGIQFKGVDVYEGDRIKHIQGEQEKPQAEFDCEGVVKFSWGSFYIEVKNGRQSTLYLHNIDGRGEITYRWETSNHRNYVYELAKDFEVVGNIHQTAEPSL